MSDNTVAPILACHGLAKHFDDAGQRVAVLTCIDLQVAPGESVAITGASGSGKSTLLHLLGGLETPNHGSVVVAGQTLSELGQGALARLRNRTLGFVYQFHHLLPEFSALENVAMPLFVRGAERRAARERAVELLNSMGLAARLAHKPAQLSGGERQRVAIARALAGSPNCVLADEPTGNLDPHTAAQVFAVLLQAQRQRGTGLVMVTHDKDLARRLDRWLILDEGVLKPA